MKCQVTFICRDYSSSLIKELETEFPVILIPGRSDRSGLIESSPDSHRLLEEYDANESSAAIKLLGLSSIDWVVVDHYGLSAIWEEHILRAICNEKVTRLLAIDDLANRPHACNILVDQNYVPDRPDRYAQFVDRDCVQLLGTDYVLMNRAYLECRRDRSTRNSVEKVVVFFGGADPQGLTIRCLRVLCAKEFRHLKVSVVVGQMNRDKSQIYTMCCRQKNFTFLEKLTDLASLYAEGDLAIGAGGSSNWERLCINIPSIVITFGEDQKMATRALSREGLIFYVGDAETVSDQDIHDQITVRIKQSYSSLLTSSDLIDGAGVRRIHDALMQFRSNVSNSLG